MPNKSLVIAALGLIVFSGSSAPTAESINSDTNAPLLSLPGEIQSNNSSSLKTEEDRGKDANAKVVEESQKTSTAKLPDISNTGNKENLTLPDVGSSSSTFNVAAPSQDTNELPESSGPANTANENAKKSVQLTPAKTLKLTVPSVLELLEQPISIDPGLSLMFSEQDMFNLILPSLELYDRVSKDLDNNSPNQQAGAGDDLTGLLESLKIKGETKEKELDQPPPNIYLGSIVFYSNDNWSVWINGKKLTNKFNASSNPIYVQSINREKLTLSWKPKSMAAINKILNNRKISTPETVTIDSSTILITLRPNQTFVPKLLAVLEGMVTQKDAATP